MKPRYIVGLTLIAGLLPFYAQAAAIFTQTAYTGVEIWSPSGSGFTHDSRFRPAQTFEITSTTTVRAYTVASSALCYTSGDLRFFRSATPFLTSGSFESLASYGTLAGRASAGTFGDWNVTKWSDATGISLSPGYYLVAESGTGQCNNLTVERQTPINKSTLSFSGGTAQGVIYASGAAEYRTSLTASTFAEGDLVFSLCTDTDCGIAATPEIPWELIQFPVVFDPEAQAIAASSSLWSDITASTTLADLSNCALAGNFFSEALCTAGAFLFSPSSGVFSAALAIPSHFREKFPFSWIFDIYAIFSGYEASEGQMETLSIDFTTVDSATTTPFGAILPELTFLSSTTVRQFVPDSVWDAYFALMRAALWLMLLGYVLNSARQKFNPRITI